MGRTPERRGQTAPRLPLARIEWASLIFAAIVAHAFLLREWLYPSAWDATKYLLMGREIAAHGVFSNVEGYAYRTYGYPLFLSGVLRASTGSRLPFMGLLFAVQLCAYLAAAYFLRSALAPASSLAARIAFCGLLVNFYALIYAPQSLTESVSLSLVVAAAGAWVVAWWRGLAAWAVLAGSLAVGIALMIRPGNIGFVCAWVVGLAVLWHRQRPPAGRVMLCALALVVGLALPIAPQIRNNVVHFGNTNLLIAADLGHLQQVLGVRYLKYATAMPPVPQAAVPYANPLVAGTILSEKSPLSWYADYPLRGLATIALHTFNLTDQDLLFTYSRDLRPWYRIPLGIINHAVVALGMLGLVLLGRSIHAARDLHARDAFVVLLSLIGMNWAIYAWTAVEMRFGFALLLILFPLAGYAAMRIVGTRRAGAITAGVLGVCVYVVLALLLSDWVREQAPAIRQASFASADSVLDKSAPRTTQ